MKKLIVGLSLLMLSLNAHAVVGMAIGYALGSSSSSSSITMSNEVDLTKATVVCRVHSFDDTKCRGQSLPIPQYIYSKGYKHYRARSYIIQPNYDYIVFDVWN
jgi:hypothetical protein